MRRSTMSCEQARTPGTRVRLGHATRGDPSPLAYLAVGWTGDDAVRMNENNADRDRARALRACASSSASRIRRAVPCYLRAIIMTRDNLTRLQLADGRTHSWNYQSTCNARSLIWSLINVSTKTN